MPKPNESHTLTQLKTYVRNHNLDKGEVPLSLNKAAMVKRLKMVGHWDTKYAAKQALKKGGDKPPMKADKPKKPRAVYGKKNMAKGGPKSLRKKPLDQGQKDFLAGIT